MKEKINHKRKILDVSRLKPGGLPLILCRIFAALWCGLFVWSILTGNNIAVGLQAFALLLFVVMHAALSNSWRGFCAFFAIAIIVSFAFEASSIATGFPFGSYHHNAPGPKPLGVPMAVPIYYALLGWLAWTLARLIIRRHPWDAAGQNRFTTPIVATFILAGYDFAFDAIGSTVMKMYTYDNPSGYFGVPLSNFLGWLLTGWVFFQLFALVEEQFPAMRRVILQKEFWLMPCLVWGIEALQYPIKHALAPAGTVAVAGRVFITSDIYEASVVVSLLTMLFAATTAALRLLSGGSDEYRES